MVLREVIIYGGESAYSFQYRDLLTGKYGRDDDWLLANNGFSIHDGHMVVKAVGAILNDRPMENIIATRAMPMEEWTYRTELDLSMIVRRENVAGPWTLEGILTRPENAALDRLVKQIEAHPSPALMGIGFMVLTLGEKAVLDLSRVIEEMASRSRTDGRCMT